MVKAESLAINADNNATRETSAMPLPPGLGAKYNNKYCTAMTAMMPQKLGDIPSAIQNK